MAFTTITTGEIASGEPNTNGTWTKVKDNLDDLDSRVTALDLTVALPPIIFRVNGNPSKLVFPFTGFLKTTINFNMKITGVYLLIDTAGSAGSTTVDLLYSRAGAAYVSILTTKPSITYQGGNDAISSAGAYSTAAVINTTYDDLLAGDIIRLDVTAGQTASRNFIVRVDYTKT